MKKILDIHSHILADVDDGAKSKEESFAMLEAAYKDGTEALCLTPHFEPESFDYTVDDLMRRFSEAKAYAAEHCPGLALYLGNEMSFRDDGAELLRAKRCLTIADSRYVLVDFFGVVEFRQMMHCLESLQSVGYIPVVAHVERYPFVWGKLRELAALAHEGVLFQTNVGSLMRAGKGSAERKTAEKLLARGVIDVIASDAHDITARPPCLSACFAYVAERYGQEYAELLFHDNPKAILNNQSIQV